MSFVLQSIETVNSSEIQRNQNMPSDRIVCLRFRHGVLTFSSELANKIEKYIMMHHRAYRIQGLRNSSQLSLDDSILLTPTTVPQRGI